MTDLQLNILTTSDKRGTTEAADGFDKVARSVDDAGDQMKETAVDAGLLNAELEKSRLKVRALTAEFDKTGNTALLKAIRGERGKGNFLASLVGELEDPDGIPKALETVGDKGGHDGGKKAGKSMVAEIIGELPVFGKFITSAAVDGATEAEGALSKIFSSLPPEAQVAIGVGVAAAISASASFIGAAFTGALLGGVGLAGIGVGIAGQLHSPAVSGALDRLKEEVSSDLTHATSAFGPVLVDVAQKAESAFDRLEPGLTKTFNRVSPAADRFLSSLIAAADRAAPGIERALDKSTVVLDELSADLPELGHDFSMFFELVADGSHGGADALHDLISAVGFLVVATGAELDLLSKMFTALEVTGDLATGHIGAATAKIAELKDGSHEGADAANHLQQQLAGVGTAGDSAAAGVDAVDQAVLQWTNDALNAKLSTLQWKDALTDFGQQLRDNKGAFNDHSAAGRADEEMYLQLVQQIQASTQATYDSTGSAVAASKAYQQQKAQLDAAAAAAGASKKQIDALNQSLDNTVKIRKGSVDITVSVHGNGQSLLTRSDSDITRVIGTRLQLRASGGPVVKGQPYVVGDGGRPELFVPDTNGTILPQVPGGYSGPASRSTTAGGRGIGVRFLGNTDTAFATAFMGLVRNGYIQLETLDS